MVLWQKKMMTKIEKTRQIANNIKNHFQEDPDGFVDFVKNTSENIAFNLKVDEFEVTSLPYRLLEALVMLSIFHRNDAMNLLEYTLEKDGCIVADSQVLEHITTQLAIVYKTELEQS